MDLTVNDLCDLTGGFVFLWGAGLSAHNGNFCFYPARVFLFLPQLYYITNKIEAAYDFQLYFPAADRFSNPLPCAFYLFIVYSFFLQVLGECGS